LKEIFKNIINDKDTRERLRFEDLNKIHKTGKNSYILHDTILTSLIYCFLGYAVLISTISTAQNQNFMIGIVLAIILTIFICILCFLSSILKWKNSEKKYQKFINK